MLRQKAFPPKNYRPIACWFLGEIVLKNATVTRYYFSKTANCFSKIATFQPNIATLAVYGHFGSHYSKLYDHFSADEGSFAEALSDQMMGFELKITSG